MSLPSQQGGYRPSISTSSLITPSLLALTDSPSSQSQIDASVQDYLLIELVHSLRRSSQVARDRLQKREDEMLANGLLTSTAVAASTLAAGQVSAGLGSKTSLRGLSAAAGATANVSVTEEEEAIRVRLEALGAHVGANLAERYVVHTPSVEATESSSQSLSADRGRFTDTLDVIKFLCKDVWTAVWDKQIDNLRTNHRGVYVLQDNAFRPILRISSADGPADSLKRAKIHTAFPAGLLRGALARLGLQGVIIAEIPSLPQCTFQVKLPKGT
ncbi:NO signaling/Golgi transport ligand-binding domain-containing protein [Gautieria morchelliformis]|nr:NO signaling/Golgi transport ligand-binding domain-containing protein [Gautieria morchelliformis]